MLSFRYLAIYIVLWMGGSLPVRAQADTLVLQEPGVFLKELREWVLNQRKAAEPQVQAFTDVFEGQMDEDQQLAVMQACTRMRAKRIPAVPYFQDYMGAVALFFQQGYGRDRFYQWNAVVDSLVSRLETRKLSPIRDFLAFSHRFFQDQSLRYSELGTSWYARTPDWRVQFEGEDPVVRFPAFDLVAVRKQDSISISNTEGVFFPVTTTWRGQGGRVSWDRFPAMEEGVYVELQDYQIDLSKSLYEAQHARLYYPLYFGQKAVVGRFSDKLVVANVATESSYPRFESKAQILKIDNFGEGVEFIGGFRLQGMTVYGGGTGEERATLRILDPKTRRLLFQGKGESFTIRREERISAEQVDCALYFQQGDSLSHPSVNIRYEVPTRTLRLSRGKRGSDRYPFASSFHNVNINADKILAFFDADSLAIGQDIVSFSRKQEAEFESLDLFDPSEYHRIQNIATVNPIAVLKSAVELENTRVLPAQLVAQKINPRYTVENITGLLYDLVSKGFIAYDPEASTVEVRDKVFLYANADRGKVDYDQIDIKSVVDSANASLNYKNQALRLNGVKNLEFSRRQRVAVVPDEQRLTLKQDRDMEFHGLVYAGYSTFRGRWFHFDYDPFHIEMDSIHFMDLYVPTDMSDQPVSIGSRIEDLSGVLLIDAPKNKSGRDDIPIFPSFQSKGDSYVYYDRGGQDSTYLRDSFYFELKPFSFNSLDRYGPEDIRFPGTMASSGIFPEFEETLVLQEEDLSLGFVRATPEEGFDTFGGKGRYKGDVILNNSGLQGKGNLNYLNASIDSEDLLFKPREVTASADAFDLEEERTSQRETPEVHGSSVSIDWKPYKDSMYVSSTEGTPFEVYKDLEANLDGTVVLSPGGLSGIGTLSWERAEMKSDLFSLGAASARADTTTIGIRAIGAPDEFALYTDGVNGYVDFEANDAAFVANEGELETTLPFNQYKTSMNEFSWDMTEELIDFKSDNTQRGRFTSIHPDQDSLNFEAETAAYDLKNNGLLLGGVPFIPTCDALVYPDSNEVEIQPGGVIKTLTNARIVADTSNQYHVINRATVDILGRKHYEASGFYEYNLPNREQEIEFASVVGERIGKGAWSEKATETRAQGEVTEADSFFIDFKTRFQGTISLRASSKNLTFDGFALLDADRLPEKQWFYVSSEGDKKDLAIRFDEPKNLESAPLYTGLYVSRETTKLYPRVLMPLGFRKDRELFRASGIFKYKLAEDAFYFGDSSKVIQDSLVGNRLIYKNKRGTVEAEGRFNLGEGLKYISVDAAGTAASAFPSPQDTVFGPFADYPFDGRFMAGISMIVPEKLLKIMTNDIQASSFDAKNISYLSDINFYKKAAYELFPVGEEKAVKEAVDGLTSGFLDLPPKFNPYTFLFSDLPMVWSPDLQSMVSSEKELGLASIGGVGINKQLECYVEFKMPSNMDDRLYLYIKAPMGSYYFFGFKQGILNITSNNTTFMDELYSLKKKEIFIKMDDGETYEITAVEPRTARIFINRINAALEGGFD